MKDVSPHSKTEAFTLLELLAVVVIITALMGMLLPVVGAVRRKAKEGKARVQIQRWVERYRLDLERYRAAP